jgi:hypothetical protein
MRSVNFSLTDKVNRVALLTFFQGMYGKKPLHMGMLGRSQRTGAAAERTLFAESLFDGLSDKLRFIGNPVQNLGQSFICLKSKNPFFFHFSPSNDDCITK